MTELNLVLALFGGVALTLGLLTRWLRQTIVSENVLALSLGILVGPLIFDILNISRWTEPNIVLEQVARITLAMSLMEVALRLPKREFLQHLRSYAILLGALMPLMWITSSVIVALILDVPVWVALLIGAVVTPTDPVVATSIVVGPLADQHIPQRVRDTLSAESGANDGLAYAFVMLPVLVLERSFGAALPEWLLRTILLEVGAGVLLGGLIGFGAAKLLIWSESRQAIDREPLMAFTIALALTTMGIASLLQVEDLLAVFVAGVVFHMTVGTHEDVEVEPVQGAVDQFLSIPVFGLIGLAIPLQGWIDLGLSGILVVAAVLLFRRLPAMFLVQRWVETIDSKADAAYLGWFGPIGIAALYYATSAVSQTGHEEVWIVGSLIICASIVVHGTTAAPLTRLYGRLNSKPDG